MKGEWTKVLVFGIIFLILGFLLGRITGHKGPKMHKEKMIIEKDGGHKMKKGKREHKAIIKKLRDSSFEGDTIISIDGGEIKVSKNGEEMNVEVTMSGGSNSDSEAIEEVEVIEKEIN